MTWPDVAALLVLCIFVIGITAVIANRGHDDG